MLDVITISMLRISPIIWDFNLGQLVPYHFRIPTNLKSKAKKCWRPKNTSADVFYSPILWERNQDFIKGNLDSGTCNKVDSTGLTVFSLSSALVF